MTWRDDVSAWMMQRTGPFTVRYGDSLVLSGADLPAPRRVRVPTRHGSVRCEVYAPAHSEGPLPAYVHLHGGAFIVRHPRMDDFFARFVAAETGAVVVAVDYDVAPQARYPVAQEQAHDVAAWVASRGDVPVVAGVLVDGGRVAVGGFSAGGNLAASAVLQARDLASFRPVTQVLGVPALDVAGDVDAKRSTHARPMITPALLRLVRSTYFRDAARRAEAYASPLLADDLTGLPPTVVLTAEHDLLRAEGDAYAERLSEAGVAVTHRVVPGRDHYFLDGDADRAQAREVLDLVAERLRAAFS